MTYLASVWGAEELLRYDGLYREGHGKLFTWWLPQNEAPNLDEIFRVLVERRPGVAAGLRPNLEPEGPPALHRAERRLDRIELEYAMAQQPRLVQDGWDEREITPIKILKAYVKQDPFTIEMRAIPSKYQGQILNLMQQDLGRDFGPVTPCLILGDAVRNRLQNAMGGLCFGVHQLGNGNASLDHTIIVTDRTVAITAQEDFVEQLPHADRREYFKWYYAFTVQHADGFIETGVYTIKVTTGELVMGKGISEFAAEILRRHVVTLFRP